MKKMSDKSIGLVVTSPPYNINNTSGGGLRGTQGCGKWASNKLGIGYEDDTDDLPHDEYISWQKQCLREMYRLIADNGAIFYNHKWRVQNGILQDRQDIVGDFPVRQVIIWQRSGGINFNDGYFVPTYEVIYLIAKPDFKLASKACSMGDVWKFPQELKNEHPAPFPIQLPARCIHSTNAKLILDPFAGSGTTGVAAEQCGRDSILIEKKAKYCELIKRRMAGIEQSLFKEATI